MLRETIPCHSIYDLLASCVAYAAASYVLAYALSYQMFAQDGCLFHHTAIATACCCLTDGAWSEVVIAFPQRQRQWHSCQPYQVLSRFLDWYWLERKAIDIRYVNCLQNNYTWSSQSVCVCVCVPRAFIQNKYFFVISTWAQAKIYWLFHLVRGSLRQRTINIVECCRHIMFETKSFHATQDMLFFSSSPYIVFDGRLRFFSMIYWFAKRDLAWRLLTDLLLPLIPSSHTSSRIRRRCSNSKHAME